MCEVAGLEPVDPVPRSTLEDVTDREADVVLFVTIDDVMVV